MPVCFFTCWGKGDSAVAAPSSTVPAASPSNDGVSFFTYIREVVVGTARVVQDAPVAVVTTEAAHLMEEVPVVGIVCRIFLSFEKLVDTAKTNKDELVVLRELCEVIIEGVLDKRSDRSGLFKGLKALETHVKRAEEVATQCNGNRVGDRVTQILLARKICNDIASVKNNLLAFVTTNNLVLTNDLIPKVSNMETFLADMMTVMEEKFELTRADQEAMRKEVALKDKELSDEVMKSGHQVSCHLKEELRISREALAAIDKKLEIQEQRRVADLASRVKVPTEAPRIRDWYVRREAVISEACRRLMIGSSTSDSSKETGMVGLTGPSGVGKSTVASMVVAREDVRASFWKGVLWLQVGEGAKGGLPDLMLRLADMVYETVMLEKCRQPREAGLGHEPEDGAAYIKEVVNKSSWRFLVVADDVWEVEVLEELKRAEVWVLYTSRDGDLLPEAPAIRLDQVVEEEAEKVLRRAADLDDDGYLPGAATDLMVRCGFVVFFLALVGRWGVVHGKRDREAWRAALKRIMEAQKGSEGGQILSWRAAVLHAGLDELACDNPQSKELYLALAVLPRGLAFPSEVAGALLYGNDSSEDDLEAAGKALETLERWSILTVEGDGRYCVHDEHATFVENRALSNSDFRVKLLPQWQGYMSSVRALVTFSSSSLVKIWDVLAQVGGEDIPSRPYEAALGAMNPSSAEFLTALVSAAGFHEQREDWLEAHALFSQLLEIQTTTAGVDHPDVATTLVQLGVSAFKARKTAKAEGSLAIREKAMVADQPNVATILYYLGAGVGEAGRTGEGGVHYGRALEIPKETLGVDHPGVGTTRDKPGSTASDAEGTDVEVYLRRALAIQEKALGVDHPDVAWTLHSLGTVAAKAGKPEEEERYYQRALAIQEKTLGVGHPRVGSILYNLGVAAGEAGNTENAEGYYRRALTIQKKTLGVEHPNVGATLNNLGVGAFRAGRPDEANGCCRDALEIQEKTLGDDHPDVAITLYNLGVGAFEAGKIEEAEGYYQRALTIQEKTLSIDDQYMVRTLNILGFCAFKVRRIEDAERYFGRALAIQKNTLGVHHPDVAWTLHILGFCAFKVGRTEEGEGNYRRALAIQETTLGEHHLDVAWTLCNLGVATGEAGRTEEAEGYFRRALAIQETTLGVDHHGIVVTLNNLGVAAGNAGLAMTATRYYRRALVIQEKTLGEGHPDVARTLYHLGVVATDRWRTEEAEEYYGRALAIQEKTLGVDHLDVVSTLYNLGVTAAKAGRTEDATSYYRRALAIQEKMLGVDHPTVGSTLHNLGVAAGEAGKIEEAEGHYRRALVIRATKLGADHPDVASTLFNLGIDAHNAGRAAAAEVYLLGALAIRKKTLGADHRDVARTLFTLGFVADHLGRTEEAEGYYRRALAIPEKTLGANHSMVAPILNNLGVCAYKAGRTEKAEGYYRRALAIREKTLGADHPMVAQTLNSLGVCAEAAGRTEEAEGYHRRALTIQETLGIDGPGVARALECLGAVVRKAGRTEEAEMYFQRALAIRVDHPDVVTTLDNLGVVADETAVCRYLTGPVYVRHCPGRGENTRPQEDLLLL